MSDFERLILLVKVFQLPKSLNDRECTLLEFMIGSNDLIIMASGDLMIPLTLKAGLPY